MTTLVFCGCNVPNCPRTSIHQASERDFRVVLAQDAISGLYDRADRLADAAGAGGDEIAQLSGGWRSSGCSNATTGRSCNVALPRQAGLVDAARDDIVPAADREVARRDAGDVADAEDHDPQCRHPSSKLTTTVNSHRP